MTHPNPDVDWLTVTGDPEDLCKDLDRVETALDAIAALPGGLGSTPYKITAVRRARDIIKYLRVAHDIE